MAKFDASLVALIIYLFKEDKKSWGEGILSFIKIHLVWLSRILHTVISHHLHVGPLLELERGLAFRDMQCCKDRKISQYDRM